jgi:hypothetical protein
LQLSLRLHSASLLPRWVSDRAVARRMRSRPTTPSSWRRWRSSTRARRRTR